MHQFYAILLNVTIERGIYRFVIGTLVRPNKTPDGISVCVYVRTVVQNNVKSRDCSIVSEADLTLA